MEITEDNNQLVFHAIRDILFMYVDLIESYKGFGHNIHTGSFSPLEFIDAPIYELGIDIALLQNGSAIALLCDLSNVWDECQTWNTKDRPIIREIKKAHAIGRFSHLDEIQEAFDLGFDSDEDAFREQLDRVYKKYVCGYINELSSSC